VLTLKVALKLKWRTLYRVIELFEHIDEDKNGKITLVAFREYVGIGDPQFFGRIFQAFSKKEWAEEISLPEFILGLFNFCLLPRALISKFVFNLYDFDRSAAIEAEELEVLVREVFGISKNTNIDGILTQFDRNSDGKISLHEFVEVNKRAQTIIEPACRLQTRLKMRCFGSEWWTWLQTIVFTRLHQTKCTNVAQLFEKYKQHPSEYDDRLLKDSCCCRYCCCCCRYGKSEKIGAPKAKRRRRKKPAAQVEEASTVTEVTFINEGSEVSSDGVLSEKQKRRERKRLREKQLTADNALVAKGLPEKKPPPRDGTFDVKFTSGKATGQVLLRIGVDLIEVDDELREQLGGKVEDKLEVGMNIRAQFVGEGKRVKNLTGRFLPAQITRVNVDKVAPDGFGVKAVEYSAAKLRLLRQKYELEALQVESIDDDR
jgi:Ca2+-binding EF-hand superfamily protein